MADEVQAGAEAPAPKALPKTTDDATAVANMRARRERNRASTQPPDVTEPKAKQEAPAVEPEQPAGDEVQATEQQESAAEPLDELELDEIATALGIDPDDLPDKLKVKLKDGSKATVREILQSQLRDADYRRKTMEHAEQVKAFQAQSQQVSEALRQRLEQTSVLEQMMVQELRLDNAQIEKLLNEGYTDPMEYERLKIARDKRINLLNQIAQQRQAAMSEAQNAQTEQARQVRAKEQQALLREYPDLKDQAKQQAFQVRIGKSLSDMGFSNDEVAAYFSGMWDHRHIVILDKAAKYDALQTQNKTAVQKLKDKLPVVVKSGPGTQTAKEQRPNVEGLREKLRRARNLPVAQQDKLGVRLLQAQREANRR